MSLLQVWLRQLLVIALDSEQTREECIEFLTYAYGVGCDCGAHVPAIQN